MGGQLACCAVDSSEKEKENEKERETEKAKEKEKVARTTENREEASDDSSDDDECKVRVKAGWEIDGLIMEDDTIVAVKAGSGGWRAGVARFIGDRIITRGKRHLVIAVSGASSTVKANGGTQTEAEPRTISPPPPMPSIDREKVSRSPPCPSPSPQAPKDIPLPELSTLSKAQLSPPVQATVVSLPYPSYAYRPPLLPTSTPLAPLSVPATPFLHSSPAVLKQTNPTPTPVPAAAPPSPVPYHNGTPYAAKSPSLPLTTPTPTRHREPAAPDQLEWSDPELDDVLELERRLSEIKQEATYIKGQLAGLE